MVWPTRPFRRRVYAVAAERGCAVSVCRVFVFLPPSEGKAAPSTSDGQPLNLDSLALPQLTPQRQQVLNALIAASGRDDAQQVLKVGAKVMPEVAANLRLPTAVAAPAHQVYTGVLFEALDAATLTPAQLRRASEQVLVFSGLFGVTSFTDRVPSYRLAMGVNLSPFADARDPGPLATYWRRALGTELAERVGDQLVVDCRSSSYAAAFRAPAARTLVVNSFTESNGHRRVVTHFAKHARGRLAGMLLRRKRMPQSIDEVAHIAAEKWRVEVRPAQGAQPNQLDLIAAAE